MADESDAIVDDTPEAFEVRKFVTLTNDIASDVPGCPQPVLIKHIRKAAIDVCERALVWRHKIEFELAPGQGEYEYEEPDDTDVVAVISAAVSADGKAYTSLTPVPHERFFEAYPGWLPAGSETPGVPSHITHIKANKFGISPVPDKAYKISLFLCLKPTNKAVGMDKVVFDDIEEVLVHGALRSLMIQPNKPWFNASMATYHAQHYTFRLNDCRAGYNLGTPRSMLVVKTAGYV